MQTFNHPNVMKLTGLSFDGETPLIVMPFMSKGNVLGYVREHREILYFTDPKDQNQVKRYPKHSSSLISEILYRLKLPERPAWECATRYQRECLTLQTSSLFTVTWLPEIACMNSKYPLLTHNELANNGVAN